MSENKVLLSLQVYSLVMIVPTLNMLLTTNMFIYLWISLLIYSIQQFFGFNAFMHRYVSHRTYETKSIYLWIMGFISTLTMVGSPLGWAYIHRAHHRYEDTSLDPHSPSHMGFFKSFFCLLYFNDEKQKESRVAIKDIVRHPILSFFNKYWIFIVLSIHSSIFLLFGFDIYAIVILLPMFLHTLVIYYFLIYHLHSFGVRDHHVTTATNSTLVNVLSLGEGQHNNHHYKPGRYDTSMYNRRKDPVAWFIKKIKE